MTIHNSITNKRSISLFTELENRFNSIHSNKYNYSSAIYLGTKTKLIIICPIHGPFEQSPQGHLAGKGCRKCAVENNHISQTRTTSEFIMLSKELWKDSYDYTNTIYVGNKTPLTLFCNKHKKEFKQIPGSHLAGAQGCKECVNEQKSLSRVENKTIFINKAKLFHKDAYNYTNFVYIKSGVPGDIICNSCNTTFTQSPNSHLTGRGCPSCANYGFDKTKPAILYYLSINNGQAYKIGITNRTIRERFISDIEKITILAEVHFELGESARALEKILIRRYSKYKWDGTNLLTLGGNTELFNKDVLHLKDTYVRMDRRTRKNI